jgi:cell wall-associated NlpC family hydrolase
MTQRLASMTRTLTRFTQVLALFSVMGLAACASEEDAFEDDAESELANAEEAIPVEDLEMDSTIATTATQKNINNVISAALAQRGKPYVWGGESVKEGGFDCSGLMYYAYLTGAGIKIPRTTYDEWKGKRLPFAQRRPGDLVFFHSGSKGPEHVAMYYGRDKKTGSELIIEAPNSRMKIGVYKINRPGAPLSQVVRYIP